MANDGKYLTVEAGRQKQELALQASAGAGDAGKIPRLDGTGRLDNSMMPLGLASDSRTITTSEALAAGDMVNVWNSTGLKSRKADATTVGKEANGFVIAAFGSGASATVFFEGTVSGLTGLTIGARYYLNTTAGTITATPLTGSGNVHQYIGTALSATELTFEPDDGIILA
jgi:hypothetical protein